MARIALRGPSAAAFLLRPALALPLLLFGHGKFADPLTWMGFIPPWMGSMLPISIDLFLKAIGTFEMIVGTLLLLGIWTRVAAVVTALHLAGVLVVVGWNDLAVRDFGLLLAALALAALQSSGFLSIDGLREKRSVERIES